MDPAVPQVHSRQLQHLKTGFGNILSSSYSSIASEKFFKRPKNKSPKCWRKWARTYFAENFPPTLLIPTRKQRL